MTYNPSDKDGWLQSQLISMGFVVSDNDPEKSGRMKIRICGEQDDEGKIPDEKLPWVQCVTNNQPQLKHVGSFGSNYRIGSKVLMVNLGQQGWTILGAMPNGEQDDKKTDIHPSVRGKEKKVNDGGTKDGNVARKSVSQGSVHNKRVVNEGIDETTQNALNVGLNNIITNLPFLQNIIPDIVQKAKTEAKYDQRSAAKVLSGFKSFGNVAFNKMDMTNPTKEVARISQELIPNAVSMIEQLKKTAESGQNVLANLSVGGFGNILGAIQGVAALLKQESNRNNQQDSQNNLEEELRRIYRELTGKEPLDQFGKETAQYTRWKEAYLRGEIISV